jgi:hypothetical protein
VWGAPDPATSERPEWLTSSHDAAQLAQAARASGQANPEQGAKPWVANAMVEALEKYEAMARARAGNSTTSDGS